MPPLPESEPSSPQRETKGQIRGSILLVAGRVLAIALNFIVQILTVRYLTKSDYGLLAYALSIGNTLAVAFAAGMDKAAARFLAVYLEEQNARKFWGMLSIMLASISLFSACGLGMFFLGLRFDWIRFPESPDATLVLSIIAWLALCNAIDAVFISVFAVMASPFAIFVRRHLMAPLLKLAAAFLVIMFSGGVVAFAAGQLLAGILGTAICIGIFQRLLRDEPKIASAFLRPYLFPLKEIASYGATVLAGDVSFLLRTALVPIVVGLFYATEEVARYQSVQPIARLIEFVLVAFSLQFIPQASRLAHADDVKGLQSLYEETIIWIALLSYPIFAVAMIGSTHLPVILFGDEYANSSPVLAWLAVGFYANACFGITLRLLRAQCGIRTILFSDVGITAVAAALVFTMIPRFGAVGGAIAVFGTFLFQSAINLWLVTSRTTVNPWKTNCWLPFLLGTTLALTATAGNQLFDSSAIYAATACCVTTIILLLAYGRHLKLLDVLPELDRVPGMRRLFASPINTTN